jgi:hypothetical protein
VKRILIVLFLVFGAFAGMAEAQTSVTFAYQIGSTVPSPILESITTQFAPLNLTVSTSGQSWLLASLSGTVTPAVLTVSVAPTGLTVGTYSGVVTVAATGSNAITFNVTLTVTAAPPPTGQFVVSPTTLAFTTPINGTPFSQSLTVNSNGGALSYQASSSAQWLIVIGNGNPTQNGWDGTTPGSVSVFASATSLAVGTYSATITLTSSQASNSPVVIPVTLTVNPTGQTPPPTLSRIGVFSHFAAGAGWTSVMTLVNTSSTAEPVTVNLYGDNGSSPTLPITTTQKGVSQTTTASSVQMTLNPNETVLLSMGDQLTTNIEGWADVLSSGSLGGFEIFRWDLNNTVSEGTVPLQAQYPTLTTIPYDDTNGFFMGVALTNLSSSLAPVTVTMWDESGNQLGAQFLTIPANGHTSFLLANQFSLTVAELGIVQFQSAVSGGIVGIGLRFQPSGTFTSVPTM